jgi:hypothetical protein
LCVIGVIFGGHVGVLGGGWEVAADSTDVSEAEGVSILDTSEDERTPGVEPGRGLIVGFLDDFVVFEGLVEYMSVASENVAAAVVKCGGFAEDLEVTGSLT